MPFENQQRLTRRRSSAGPTPPRKPLGGQADSGMRQNSGPRPTFLTLRDHGKVYVADFRICLMDNFLTLGKKLMKCYQFGE